MLLRLLAARSARSPAVVVVVDVEVVVEAGAGVFPVSLVSRRALLLKDLTLAGSGSGFRSLLSMLDFDERADFDTMSLLLLMLPVREWRLADAERSSPDLISEELRAAGTELCRRDVRDALARSIRGRDEVDVVS